MWTGSDRAEEVVCAASTQRRPEQASLESPGRVSSGHPKVDDRALMRRVASGDRDACTQLYTKYLLSLQRLLTGLNCQACTLDDVTQEVFARLWECRRAFRGSSQVQTYLLAIARNIMAEERRRRQRQPIQIRVDDLSELVHSTKETDRTTAAEATTEAMRLLPNHYRTALVLFHLNGLTARQASRVTHCSEKAFKHRLARARLMLRSILSHRTSRQGVVHQP